MKYSRFTSSVGILQFFGEIGFAIWTGQCGPSLKEPRDALPAALTPTQRAVAAGRFTDVPLVQSCVLRKQRKSPRIPVQPKVRPALSLLQPNATFPHDSNTPSIVLFSLTFKD